MSEFLGGSMVSIEPRVAKNMAKLRNWLIELSEKNAPMKMDCYVDRPDEGFYGLDIDKAIHSCGSGACAIGWAPFVVPAQRKFIKPNGEVDYSDYAKHNLMPVETLEHPRKLVDKLSPFSALYGWDWHVIDNTTIGAAFRIDYVLKNKIIPRIFGTDLIRHDPEVLAIYESMRDEWSAKHAK